MRIHRLTMSAVGPYLGTEVIDFDSFAASGRFLLSGPTGSGKTTIIDAIVFALYGEVADSADSSKERIRSRHAAAGQESVVELVFSTSAGLFKVRRTPEYQRAKKRGTGTTTQNATAHLWRLTNLDEHSIQEPADEPIAVGPREVGTEIGRIVGLSREQMTQTVVLPQGKFARFLRASSQERHELLRDVFGTDIYDRIQDELAERSRSARSQAEAARSALTASVGVLIPLLPEETSEGSSAPDTGSRAQRLEGAVSALVPDEEVLSDTLDEALAVSQAGLSEREAAQAQAAERRDEAARALQQVRERAALIARRAGLLAEQKQLEESAEADDAAGARLSRAERAARTSSPAQAAQRQARAALTALDGLTAVLGRLPEESGTPLSGARSLETLRPALLDTADAARGSGASTLSSQDLASLAAAARADAEALGARADEVRLDAGGLHALVESEATLASRRTALAEERAAHAAELDAIAQDQAALEQRPARYDELKDALDAARRAEQALPALDADHDAARSRHEAALRAVSLDARLASAEEALTAAREAAEREAGTLHACRRAWIAVTAGSLAAELQDGEPCPVCGSVEHPCPAEREEGTVTRADVEAVERAERQAADTLTRRAAEKQDLLQQRARAEQEAGGLDVTATATALEQAEAALARRRAEAEPVESLSEAVEGFAQQTAVLTEALAARRATADARAARLTDTAQQLDAEDERLARARGTASTVKARMTAMTEHADALAAAAHAVRSALDALSGTVQAASDLAAALSDAGFSCLASARAAALPADELEALRSQVTTVAASRERVRQGLAEEAIAALTGEESADVPAAEAAHALADEEYTAAVRAAEQARSAHLSVEAAAQGVRDAAAALAHMNAHQEALLRVAGLVTGTNDHGTPLATWVLVERFREVLTFANQRLAEMSDGRFELTRTTEEAGSARRKDRGLGLAVVDHRASGGERDPRTLSGGESFYVSLSLALALADVVTAEAGGIALETLFIDEGFGSLDPEALDKVMTVLSRLQAGGRTVGIVSHVEELKRQVPDRIEVRRTAVGSTLAVRAG